MICQDALRAAAAWLDTTGAEPYCVRVRREDGGFAVEIYLWPIEAARTLGHSRRLSRSSLHEGSWHVEIEVAPSITIVIITARSELAPEIVADLGAS